MNELFDFLKSNVIAIVALIFSFFALVISFISYRHGSSADLEIEVDGDWNFNYVVEKAKKDKHNIVNLGNVAEISVKNLGGVKTTLEAVYVVKKTFHQKKRVEIATILDRDIIGVVKYDEETIHGFRLSYISLENVVIEPGDRILLIKDDRKIFEHLFQKGLFNLTNQDQGKFQLIIKHTFDEEKSNSFRIDLSLSSLRLLQLDCNDFALIREYESKESKSK